MGAAHLVLVHKSHSLLPDELSSLSKRRKKLYTINKQSMVKKQYSEAHKTSKEPSN
jgi:hypothetical protein